MTITPKNYADPVVTMNTSMGSITIELFPTAAPITVNNFLTYAYTGFYDGTIFHRVVAGFVDQGGGYTAQAQKSTLPPIPLESNNGLSNVTGTIAMARTADPNSATSQFFINAVNNTYLDYVNASNPGYAVFGNVLQGLDVVEAINAVPVNSSSAPLTDIVIQSVTTSVYYQGNRSDYTITMTGGQIAVTPKSGVGTNLPTASTLSKTEQLQFADMTVIPSSDTENTVIASFQAGTLTSPTDIFDSSKAVFDNLDKIQSLASTGKLISIGFTDSATPSVTLSASQFASDTAALAAISGPYQLTVTDVTAANSSSVASNAHVGSVAVVDSANNVIANLDHLQAIAGKLASITLTDGAIPALLIPAAQATSDASALNAISGYFSVSQTATGNNLTISGIANALGNTVIFSGNASQYTITPAHDGIHFTVATTGSSDQLSNIQALQFSDVTEFIAPAPGTGGVNNGGNITELYAAVFGRVPDVQGLSYYEKELAANPGLSLTTLAQNFLSSPEYTGNSAHNYAQTSAGEAQFITDSYNNLLHRAPETGAIPYYQNLISQFTQGLTPGTAAYNAAELQAHATMLVDFSASAEFLDDVQVTAAHPASAGFSGHWLVLI